MFYLHYLLLLNFLGLGTDAPPPSANRKTRDVSPLLRAAMKTAIPVLLTSLPKAARAAAKDPIIIFPLFMIFSNAKGIAKAFRY